MWCRRSLYVLSRYTGGRFIAKCSNAKQCRRHILHSDRWSRSVNGCLSTRVRLQVQAPGRTEKGQSILL